MPEGYKVYALPSEQAEILEAMIDDRVWWAGAWKRARGISVAAGFIITILTGLALWWPWITRIVQFIIKDVPTNP